MKIIIENGGLLLSAAKIGSNVAIVERERTARQEYRILKFFNEILSVSYLSVDEDDLRNTMSVLFVKYATLFHKKKTFPFKFYFGTFPENNDSDNMDYMEVWEMGNEKRLIYVELK